MKCDFSLIRARLEDISGEPVPNTCLRFESLDGLVEFTQPSGITDGDGYVYTEIFGRPHLEEFAVTMNLFEPWNADLGVPPEIPQTPREMALVPIRDSIFSMFLYNNRNIVDNF